ncbi:MAG: phosphatidate cytidylyltransferase [Caulobacteraceae bacterium]|nr:phosphatidate cytidylyltransferase [Caulobacteraceae bacterium]
MSNLALRLASALVLIPAVLLAIWGGGGLYLMLVAVAVGLLGVEWGKMSAPAASAEIAVTVTVAILTAVFAEYVGWTISSWFLMLAGAAIGMVIARGRAERPADAAYGVVYLAPACICMIWLRAPEGDKFAWPISTGVAWTVLLFCVTWAADSGAYAAGKLFKGPKLWPRISPNKTWAGFFGGLLAATLAAMIISLIPSTGLGLATAGLIGFLGGLSTMAGDLWESLLKRRFGVKDSGEIIPGHGGALDRVDGLMFCAVVVTLAKVVLEHWR